MASAAQIRANRLNAQRSTGPRTEAGKEVTKHNALRHGLAAQDLVLPDEDPAALEALRAQLRAEHAPANHTEAMLVEDLAQCWWRLQRARLYEVATIRGTFLRNRPFAPECIDVQLRYTSATERGWHRAITQLRTAQNHRIKRELAR